MPRSGRDYREQAETQSLATRSPGDITTHLSRLDRHFPPSQARFLLRGIKSLAQATPKKGVDLAPFEAIWRTLAATGTPHICLRILRQRARQSTEARAASAAIKVVLTLPQVGCLLSSIVNTTSPFGHPTAGDAIMSPTSETDFASRTLADIASTLPGATALFREEKLDFCCGGKVSLADAMAAETEGRGSSSRRRLAALEAAAEPSDGPEDTDGLIDMILDPFPRDAPARNS